MVAAAAAPIASAQPGVGMGDALIVLGINVLGAGLGTGIAAAAGGFDSKETSRPAGSPSL
jgi:hypothetical protein